MAPIRIQRDTRTLGIVGRSLAVGDCPECCGGGQPECCNYAIAAPQTCWGYFSRLPGPDNPCIFDSANPTAAVITAGVSYSASVNSTDPPFPSFTASRSMNGSVNLSVPQLVALCQSAPIGTLATQLPSPNAGFTSTVNQSGSPADVKPVSVETFFSFLTCSGASTARALSVGFSAPHTSQVVLVSQSVQVAFNIFGQLIPTQSSFSPDDPRWDGGTINRSGSVTRTGDCGLSATSTITFSRTTPNGAGLTTETANLTLNWSITGLLRCALPGQSPSLTGCTNCGQDTATGGLIV